jgi:DNA-binding NtrC family response regulator
LPTLSDRAEDIRAMVLEILSRTAAGPEHQPLGISRAAMQALLDHSWPGNELELHDLLSRSSQLETGPVLTPLTLSLVGFQAVAGPLRIASLETPDSDASSVDGLHATGAASSPPRRRRPRAPRSRRPRTKP